MHIYSCLTCSKIFQSVRGKWNPPKYCCHSCYVVTLKSEEVLAHLANARKKVIHKKSPEYICLTCSKTFHSYNKKNNPKYCTMQCFQQRIKTDETIAKMSAAKKGKNPWNLGVNMWEGKEHPRGTLGKKIGGGEKCHFWKGGVTSKNMMIRKSTDYAKWRKSVFERDGYTCVVCFQKGGRLNADHILPFSTHPEIRFSLENGRTLCRECHMKTETYGGKMNKKIRNT